jgi:hypothetical protein
MNWNGYGRKRSWGTSKYYTDISLEGMRKKHTKPQCRQPVSGPRLEPGASLMRNGRKVGGKIRNTLVVVGNTDGQRPAWEIPREDETIILKRILHKWVLIYWTENTNTIKKTLVRRFIWK